MKLYTAAFLLSLTSAVSQAANIEQYVVMDKKGNGCPAGFKLLSHANCVLFANSSPDLVWSKAYTSHHSLPKGCHASGTTVYYNRNGNGRPKDNYYPICEDLATRSPTTFPTKVPTSSPTTTPTTTPTFTLPQDGEWYIIDNGDVTTEIVSSDSIHINLPFNASNRDHGSQVFTNNCTTPFDNNNHVASDTTQPTSDTADGFIQFVTEVTMNISSLITSKYWNTFSDGSNGGWVELCVETYLNHTDKNGINPDEKIMTANNLLNISVSYNADFSLVANVDKEILVTERINVDYSEYINAYECAETNIYTDLNGASPKTYIEGDTLLLCVTDDNNGIVQVDEINNLKVSHVDTVDYHYVKDSVYDAALTTRTCHDGTGVDGEGRVCYVGIFLLARFFTYESITITGSAVVVLDNGRRVRRDLRMEVSTPSQKNEDNTFAESARRAEENKQGAFAMEISLKPTNGISASDTFGIGATGFVTMIAGAAGAALLV